MLPNSSHIQSPAVRDPILDPSLALEVPFLTAPQKICKSICTESYIYIYNITRLQINLIKLNLYGNREKGSSLSEGKKDGEKRSFDENKIVKWLDVSTCIQTCMQIYVVCVIQQDSIVTNKLIPKTHSPVAIFGRVTSGSDIWNQQPQL